MEKQKRLLTVVRWPLGGIRTYMRYVYNHFGSDWEITILAADTQESAALREDAKVLGAELILAPASSLGFLWVVFKALAQRRHDIIQSQGFISAITVCLANLFFSKPHVLTVHGILEDRLLQGLKGRLNRLVTNWAICSVDVVYAVSEDILAHVQQQVPCLAGSRAKQVAITNGIESQIFLGSRDTGEFRSRHGLRSDLFLFGFLGRFMPQKGFDIIIDALVFLEKNSVACDYRLVAVGSGDYRSQYEAMAKEKGVYDRIVFLPFQKDVATVYQDLDAVVMPSRWEAFGLLAAETLASGIPLIGTDCIGLREVLQDTPAIVVPKESPKSLAIAMEKVMLDDLHSIFKAYQDIAAKKYDISNTAQNLKILLQNYV